MMTKGQKTAIERVERMMGKDYPEPSLRAEIRQILGDWIGKKTKTGIVLSNVVCGLLFELCFKQLNKHTFRLVEYHIG